MRVHTIYTSKGGTGKSTVSSNLASFFSYIYKDKGILLIDADPQQNSTVQLGSNGENGSLMDVLTGKKTFKDVIFKGNRFHLVPSSPELTMADKVLGSEIGREYILREKLKEIEGEYNDVFQGKEEKP